LFASAETAETFFKHIALRFYVLYLLKCRYTPGGRNEENISAFKDGLHHHTVFLLLGLPAVVPIRRLCSN
jgi:hypothetical protein